jgi:UDP-3-O-acyl-N-acetylglucosamine deacetylase
MVRVAFVQKALDETEEVPVRSGGTVETALDEAEEVPVLSFSTVEEVLGAFSGYAVDSIYLIIDSASVPRPADPWSLLFENETLVVIEPPRI